MFLEYRNILKWVAIDQDHIRLRARRDHAHLTFALDDLGINRGG